MLISPGQICRMVQAPFLPLPVCLAAVTAGREQALLLWTIFGVIAAAVPVALVITISSALRRRMTDGTKQRREAPLGLIFASILIISNYLILILPLFLSNARISMLTDGHVGMFFRAFVFPHGSVSVRAVICIIFWAGLQGGVVWMLWRLRRPRAKPRVSAAAPDMVRVPAIFKFRRWPWLFLMGSFAVVVFLFLRLYPIQVAVDRDMAADRTARHQLMEAQDKAAGIMSKKGHAKELIAAWKRTDALDTIAASRSGTLAAAEQERNRRVFEFEYVSLGLAVFWLVFAVGRMRSALGRRRGAERFISR